MTHITISPANHAAPTGSANRARRAATTKKDTKHYRISRITNRLSLAVIVSRKAYAKLRISRIRISET